MMNRRKLLYSLSSLSAASLSAPWLFSPNGGGSAEHGRDHGSSRNKMYSPHESLRVGLVGVVGVGVYFLYRVARQLDYPCKTIAIELNINNDRLRWCHPEHSSFLLIGGHDEIPATITDAQRMGRDRKSDIANLVSGLDVAFLVTGLNGISGKGVTSVVAETLGVSGVFTIAVVPGRREADAVDSLRQNVDVAIEIPYPWQLAPGAQDLLWREQFAATIARKCREITLSLV